VGRDSVVDRATGQSGDRIPVGARFSAPVQTGPGVHPTSYTMGTGSLPVAKRPGRSVNHSPHLTPKLKKEYSYTATSLWAFMACSEVSFTLLQRKYHKYKNSVDISS